MRKRHFVAAAILLAAASGPAAAQKYAAVIQPSTPLPAFCAGKTATVNVWLGNNGVGAPALWTTNNDYLKYHWKQGATTVVYDDGLKTSLPTNVPAGGHTSVAATVKAPGVPGTYDLVFDMAAADAGWFEWFGSKIWSQTVTVQSVAQCAISASMEAMPSALLPKIDGCFPGTETGGFVVCWGQNFGATKGSGKILMKGLPIGDLDLSSQPNLKWNDTSFYAQVSPDISGFPKQKVRIQVVTAAHGSTNEFTIDITPAMDLQPVPGSLVTYTTTDTGCIGCFSDGPVHGNNFFGDNGTDTWTGALLANGWVYDSVQLSDTSGALTFPLYGGSSTANLDHKPQTTFAIKWAYDNWFTTASYAVTVFATGPRGVPMQ